MFQKTIFYYEKWREKKLRCILCRQIYDSQHLDKAHKSCQSKAKKKYPHVMQILIMLFAVYHYVINAKINSQKFFAL